MTQKQDHHYSMNSNTAGAPLPLIPRRASSSRPTLTPSPSLPLPDRSSSSAFSSSSSTTVTTITPATPVRNDSDSGSSSSSVSDGTRPTIRTRRIRGLRNGTVCPPELSTPIPTLAAASTSPLPPPKYFKFPSQTDNATTSVSHVAPSRPMLYSPGMPLRLSVESIKAAREAHVSHPPETSAQGAQSSSAFCEPFGEERLIRKKSGQLVKSSLKSSRSVSRSNSLSVFTLPQSSKSEPTTPTSKAVHFDSKLEHVKLFLAEQKPLAVSRDGSPTDDTSGTDSDFPRFIFGDSTGGNDRRQKKKLIMQVPNMPERVNLNSDVALEELNLSADGTSILGKVRVRNISFAKWVVVRFTFDSWQTTSEVAGKYSESLSKEFDRFSFSIRLNDLLARIEGKALFIAVRYSVEGREMWDNNSGLNYLATFTKEKMPEESRSPLKTTLSDDEGSTDLADLKSKLEKVEQSDDRTGPAFLAQNIARRTPASADADVASFRSSASFASRYDFAASLKSSWNPDAAISSAPLHTRTKSYPLSATKSNGNSIPWPQTSPSDPYALQRAPPHPSSSSAVPVKALAPKSKSPALGSPRDLGDDAFRNFPRSPVEFEDAPFPVNPQPSQARNHQRGYFDLAIPAAAGPVSLRRTSPGTPRSPDEDGYVVSPQRFNSFPPMEPSLSSSFSWNSTPTPTRITTALTTTNVAPINGYGADNGGDSELSTPSMVTPSSSRESSPSPTEAFMNMVDDENASSLSPDTHYRQFLNKFCFFTGPGTGASHPQEPDVEHIPRTHSASDIEEFLAGISPRLHAIANGVDPVSPTRSPSLDDLMLNRSGSLTPTVSRLSFMNANSQNATPVLV
ncbi:hypothetical protein GALMADRAFT_221872 [Galerina marginata CBS 339.88]|uniref:CBM21 domain-containing protein n=1 Tax=Galerina marginata (strain CBS 339.88) TaxID=685588 RepID=A0A067TI41_GALM3|nr:hypothetical protein GALMADRAFT_221872 [Galerina marginata CBS 339.88]